MKSIGREGKTLWAAFLIFSLTAIVYIPVYTAGFIWDDDAFLTANELILSPDGLFRIWFTTEAPDYFPLVSTSLWLEWRVWGEDATGYHAVNVALHALGAYLLYLILSEAGIRGSLFAALIFAVHPVNVESVAWITERKNTLALPLYFASILYFMRFLRGGKLSSYLISLLLFFLSLLAKTSVVMLPLVLLGLVWWKRGAIRIKEGGVVLPFLSLSAIMGLVTVWFQYNRAIGDEVIRGDGPLSRLATAGVAVWFYLYKAVLPLNLLFVYPRWDLSHTSPLILLPLFALLLCLAGFWYKRASWGRVPLYVLAYFLVTLLPVLGFLNIYFMKFSLVADHWQYFAIAGPILLLAYLWGSLRERALERGASSLMVVGAILIVLFGTLSFNRARVYTNELTLYNDIILKNRSCWMAYNNRGNVHDRLGELNMALEDFSRAIELKPDYAEAYFNRGVLQGRSGKMDKAMEDYTAAIESRVGYGEAHYNRGLLYYDKGLKRAALEDFTSTILINPDFFRAYINRGSLLAESGNRRGAMDDFDRAIELEPGSSEALLNRGVAFALWGDLNGAIADFTMAIDLNDGDIRAYVNRSRAYRELGSHALSERDMEAAVRLGYPSQKTERPR